MISANTTVAAAQRAVMAGKGHGDAGSGARFWALTLGSIGVVYGDIGTSPLYAMRESVVAAVGPAIQRMKPPFSEFCRSSSGRSFSSSR
jgi:hypothetical protein